MMTTLGWMKDHGQDVRNPSGGPSLFRAGLARKFGTTPEAVDAAIATVWGESARVHAEDAAQRILASDRRASSTDSRHANHEED